MHTHRIRLRRRTSAGWLSDDPILGPGEPGLEKDTGRLKIGNGIARWSELPAYYPRDEDIEGGETLAEHVVSDLPHPVYDDAPSLSLLYENAKV